MRPAPAVDRPGAPVRTPPATGRRCASLDGLRGLAALVVVVHHCALTLPALAQQWSGPVPQARTWWLAYTPLHLLWAGDEAVLLFFVLSGLVLARPLVGRSRRPGGPGAGAWPAYYRKRLVRLYLPVVAAVALTGAVLALVPRTGDPGWSWWMAEHVTSDADLPALLRDAVLLGGTDWRNSVLWSMRVEMWFSLLLPVFVVLVRDLQARLALSLPALLGASGWAAAQGHDLLSLLCVCGVGVLLAREEETLARWGRRVTGSGAALWAVVGGAGLLLLMSSWVLRQLALFTWVPAARGLVVLGAAVVVCCALHCPVARRVGESRPLRWLGGLSFSLYLVHEPLVVSLATVLPPTPRGFLVVLAVGVPLSLLAAVLFHRAVERPAMRLANRFAGPRPRAAAPAVAAPPTRPMVVPNPSVRRAMPGPGAPLLAAAGERHGSQGGPVHR